MDSVQPVFTVRSVHAAIRWYTDVLGFETSFKNEDPGEPESLNYAVLVNGNVGLHLGLERDMGLSAGNGSCNFVTGELDAYYARAGAADVPFHVELGTIPTGQRTFGIQDPDGNLLTFVEAA